jgi:antirestriction protein
MRGGAAMEEQPREGANEEERDSIETQRVVPRVYVASLSDYNHGRLHGAWIEAAQDEEVIDAAVSRMLATSEQPDAEEFGIFDYEGFGPARIDMYEPLAEVSRMARCIVEHGTAFAHYSCLLGTHDPERLERFEDVYLGHFASYEAFGDHVLESFGLTRSLTDDMPGLIAPYVSIDVEQLAVDMELNGGIVVSVGEDGIYVFDQDC